jgi:serine/threonine protein kinase
MSTFLIARSSGRTIVLDKKLASSGEGTVWTTNCPGFLAKLYHHPTRDRIEKLKVMVTHPPQNPMQQQQHVTFAWPQDLLQSQQGQYLGFLMPEIADGVKLSLIYNPKLRNRKAPRFNWYYLHTAALNFALALKSLHEEGYVVGDIKPQNLLVNSRALISVIDTDSFQVRDPQTQSIYRCLVGSEGFTPAELLGKELATLDQTEIHDRFRIGVMVYMLLFGDQPFKGKWVGRGESPQPAELIRQGFWPYAPQSLVQPGPNTIPLSIVHPQLQVCFQRCFTEGFKDPNLRPSAEDWIAALKLAINDLQMCHVENNHYYSRVYNRCYWCDRRSSLGLDVFSPTPTVRKPPPVRQKAAAVHRPGHVTLGPRSSIGSTLAQHPSSLRSAAMLLRASSLAHATSPVLSAKWANPVVWGVGFIAFGLTGLALLLLPDLNVKAIQRGGSTLQAQLGRLLPFNSTKTLRPKLAELLSASQSTLKHGGHWDAITTLDLSADDRLLVSGSKDMTVKLWDVTSGNLRHTFSDHYEPIVSVGLSESRNTLIASSLSGKILVWDLQTQNLKQNLLADTLWNSEGTIRNTATDQWGQYVASSGWGGLILLQNVQSGKSLRITSNALASEQSLAMLPHGKTVVSSSSDGKFQFWNTKTGALEKTLSRAESKEPLEPISTMTISQDGRLLVSGGWYGSIHLWDVQTGRLLKTLPKQPKFISALALNERNGLLATVASDAAVIKLWNLKTGRLAGTLNAHRAAVSTLKFSHNGKFLVSGSEEPTIKIWNMATRQVRMTLAQ